MDNVKYDFVVVILNPNTRYVLQGESKKWIMRSVILLLLF